MKYHQTVSTGGTATLFERVRAAAPRPVVVVPDLYPGVPIPIAYVATGFGFQATYRTGEQAQRAAFVAMASQRGGGR